VLESLQAAFELGAEIGVGPGAVEGGAVDASLGGEGCDVAAAAGRDLAAQEPVDRSADPVLVGGALGRGDPHVIVRSSG
jgi:hypothetical protein